MVAWAVKTLRCLWSHCKYGPISEQLEYWIFWYQTAPGLSAIFYILLYSSSAFQTQHRIEWLTETRSWRRRRSRNWPHQPTSKFHTIWPCTSILLQEYCANRGENFFILFCWAGLVCHYNWLQFLQNFPKVYRLSRTFFTVIFWKRISISLYDLSYDIF